MDQRRALLIANWEALIYFYVSTCRSFWCGCCSRVWCSVLDNYGQAYMLPIYKTHAWQCNAFLLLKVWFTRIGIFYVNQYSYELLLLSEDGEGICTITSQSDAIAEPKK